MNVSARGNDVFDEQVDRINKRDDDVMIGRRVVERGMGEIFPP